MSTTTAPIQHDDIVLSETAQAALADAVHFDDIGDEITHAADVDEFAAVLENAIALVPAVRAGRSGRLPRDAVHVAVAAVEASRRDYEESAEYERGALRRYLERDDDLGFEMPTVEENVARYRDNETFMTDRIACCDAFLVEVAA